MTALQNRSLDRGIRIMEVLASEGACSLADIHRRTSIPKSTIRRLLGTLMARRLVRRSLSDSRYRINVILPVSSGEPVPPELVQLVDIVMPHAVELTRSVEWPSEFHIVDGAQMRIVDSTRPLSPFHLYRGLVNRKISIFGSASGNACLAARSDAEIAEFHRLTDGDRRWGLARFNMTLDDHMQIIREVRDRGYATRLPGYLGETTSDDRLTAIGVPIYHQDKPFAALNLLWPRIYKNHEDFADEFLPALTATAKGVDADLKRFAG